MTMPPTDPLILAAELPTYTVTFTAQMDGPERYRPAGLYQSINLWPLNFLRREELAVQPHIFIATPCYGGVVTQGYMQSIIALMTASSLREIGATLALLGQDALITRSRNTLVSHFTAHSEATHLLFIDADISFAPDAVFRLLDAEKPLIAGIYPLKAYHWDRAFRERSASGEAIETAGLHYVGRPDINGTLLRDGGVVTADFAGTGFMLIERATIERMIEAYPETAYRATDAYIATSNAPSQAYALFDCMIDPDTTTYRSEDFTFCRRWQRIGGQVWLDTGARLTHSGASDFIGDPATRFGPKAGDRSAL